MDKLKIGITLRVENILPYNEKRDAISHDWINLFQKNFLEPVLIPNCINNIRDYISSLNLNAIILSGGDNPGDDLNRDNTEINIIKYAIEKKIPLLGICRGMQVLNNYFGGKVEKNQNNDHVGKRHLINFTNKKFIDELEQNEIEVNSFHNNVIYKKNLASSLKIFATSFDNTIEGFHHEKLPILGIMWHPEREKDIQISSVLLKIFYNRSFSKIY
jgi:putative glutamine amidotransferase